MTHSTYLHLLVRTVLWLADVKGKGLKLVLADQDVGQGESISEAGRQVNGAEQRGPVTTAWGSCACGREAEGV